MNVKSVVENKEKFQVELTIEVGQEEFEGTINGNSVGHSGNGENAHQHGQGKGQELFHS